MFEKKIVITENAERVSALFQTIQDLSGEAAAEWHASGDDLAEKGLIWVIVRYDVSLLRPLEPAETLIFKTWANPVRHRMSQRNYLAFDKSGACVMRGAGSWAVVDALTRSMVDPGEYGVEIHGEVNGLELPRPATPLRITLTDIQDYDVTDAVLDRNMHMNNTKYFDAVQSCIREPNPALQLQRARAMFISESRLGERIAISWGRDGNSWYFDGKKNGASCFQISLEYV